jgi:hypothetical protein
LFEHLASFFLEFRDTVYPHGVPYAHLFSLLGIGIGLMGTLCSLAQYIRPRFLGGSNAGS